MSCFKPITNYLSNIPKDLITLNLYQKTLFFLFGILMIIFSIIDFNHFLDFTNKPYLLKWDNDTFYGYEDWRKMLMTISGVASFTGVLCVVLVSLGKISNYFWGILNCIFYGTFAFAYGYAGDAQLNIFFFLPLQFVGIYTWINKQDESSNVKVRKLTLLSFAGLLVLLGGLIITFYFEIPAFAIALTGSYFYQDNRPAFWLDVLSNSFSIVAQILLTFRYREQWIFWILVNCIQIAMFSGVGGFGIDFNVLCMWSMFLINSLYGCYRWFKESNKEGTLELTDLGKVVPEV
jgi:nicotinamide mononucleotide transporter PnuC